MIAKNITVPVALFSSLTSLVRIKFGNLDADVYSEIQKAEASLKDQKQDMMVADYDSFSTMAGLTRLKYGNRDADVYFLIEKAGNYLSAPTFYAWQSDSSTLTKVYDSARNLIVTCDSIEDASEWASKKGYILEIDVA